MGIWKRVTEKTKQAMGLKANVVEWRPTSNERNLAMIEEARVFSKQLRLLHRELKDVAGRIEANLGVLKSVLNAPLPRVYEMSDKGPVPIEKEACIVGAGVAFEVLAATSTDLKAKLQHEVLAPLEQWQNAYRMIKNRNAKVEELRLELDAKRREASAMAVSLEKQKSKVGADAAKATPELSKSATSTSSGAAGASNRWEDAEFKLQKEEDKVARLMQRYRDIEGEVYTALLTLINDTKVLKQYAATALVVFSHAFAHAYTAFNTGSVETMPLPTRSNAGTPAKVPGSTASLDGTTPMSSAAYVKSSPDTPDRTAPVTLAPEQRPAPSWYNEAKQHAKPTNYGEDSDDDS